MSSEIDFLILVLILAMGIPVILIDDCKNDSDLYDSISESSEISLIKVDKRKSGLESGIEMY